MGYEIVSIPLDISQAVRYIGIVKGETMSYAEVIFGTERGKRDHAALSQVARALRSGSVPDEKRAELARDVLALMEQHSIGSLHDGVEWMWPEDFRRYLS